MKFTKLLLLLAIATLHLSACGGAVESGPVVVDTTAPIFIGGDPDGAVLQACSVTAEFDEPIMASTITAQSFVIKEDTATAPLSAADGTWGLSTSSATIAIFIPSVNLLGDYTVTLTTDIKNTAGINLAQEETWTFNTSIACPPQ